MTVRHPADGGAGATHVNAGNALERLVRGRVGTLMLPPPAVAACSGWRITITTAGRAQLRRPGTAAWQLLTPELADKADLQLLTRDSETGLDGVILQRIPCRSGRRACHLASARLAV